MTIPATRARAIGVATAIGRSSLIHRTGRPPLLGLHRE